MHNIKQKSKTNNNGLMSTDWLSIKLAKVVISIESGVSVNSDDRQKLENEKGVLKTSSVSNGYFLPDENKVIIDSKELKRAKLNPIKDCLLISRMNTPELVGACAYIKYSREDLFIPDRLWLTKIDNDKCHSKWLNLLLNSQHYRSIIKNRATGTSNSMKNISKESFLKIYIPLPPLPEQQKIAQILYTWDRAIEQTQNLIEKLELRKKGLMQQLLTGKTRLSNYSEKWTIQTFSSIFKPKKIKVGDDKLTVFSVTKGGIIPQSEYFKKEIASEDTSTYLVVEKGDIVMSGLNFWMGSIDILLDYEKGIVSPAYKVFKVKNPTIDMTFMRFFIRSEIFLKALIGSSVQGASIVRRNLDNETLENWPFVIPTFNEQKAIGKILLAADNEIKAQIKLLENLQSQKKGLMQQLLTGQKRVKV